MFKAFRLKDLQNIKAALRVIKREGKTLDEAIIVIEKRLAPTKQKLVKSHKLPLNHFPCSKCGLPALVLAVNTDETNKVEDLKLNSVIQCQNRPGPGGEWKDHYCGHSEYSKKNVHDLMKSLNK